jgi:hypothetical protein
MPKNKTRSTLIFLMLIVIGVFLAYQVYATNLAHTTFDRYYAFRGCVQLVDKTDTYGDCKLADGQTIKLVLINNKWYLDGDGPGIW